MEITGVQPLQCDTPTWHWRRRISISHVFLSLHVKLTQLDTNPIFAHVRKPQRARQISSLELRSAMNETELLERHQGLTTGTLPWLTLLRLTGLSLHFDVRKTTGPSIQYWMRTIRWRSRCYSWEWFYLIQLLSVVTFAQSMLRWPKKVHNYFKVDFSSLSYVRLNWILFEQWNNTIHLVMDGWTALIVTSFLGIVIVWYDGKIHCAIHES
jgi:hypothetical protein